MSNFTKEELVRYQSSNDATRNRYEGTGEIEKSECFIYCF